MRYVVEDIKALVVFLKNSKLNEDMFQRIYGRGGDLEDQNGECKRKTFSGDKTTRLHYYIGPSLWSRDKNIKTEKNPGTENPRGNGDNMTEKPINALGKLQGLAENFQNSGPTKEEGTWYHHRFSGEVQKV